VEKSTPLGALRVSVSEQAASTVNPSDKAIVEILCMSRFIRH
jgi:hypothetical protein